VEPLRVPLPRKSDDFFLRQRARGGPAKLSDREILKSAGRLRSNEWAGVSHASSPSFGKAIALIFLPD
jgi:hypothetical protein